MSTCAGTSKAAQHAEPNWLEQADQQASELFATLKEIGDETATELWEALQSHLDDLARQNRADMEF